MSKRVGNRNFVAIETISFINDLYYGVDEYEFGDVTLREVVIHVKGGLDEQITELQSSVLGVDYKSEALNYAKGWAKGVAQNLLKFI